MKNTWIIAAVVVVLLAVGGWYFVANKPAATPTTPDTQGVTPDTNTAGTSGETFTMAQVAEHNSQTSCYSAIRGSVYDLTEWIAKHPGGEGAILGICGKDGTQAFVGQHGGMKQQESMLATFKIGTLSQ